MNPRYYVIAAIAVITFVTIMTRAIPFLIFGKRELPKIMTYLGNVLPPAIMVILVCYCLRGIHADTLHGFLPEILSCLVVTVVHLIRNNLYVSIIAGTLCYMFLIRVI